MAPSSRNYGRGEGVSAFQDMPDASRASWAYRCISDADVLIPRHNNSTAPTTATRRRKRVLVRKTHIARVGGKLALAAFQLTPPLGSSISSPPGGPQHTTPDRLVMRPVQGRAFASLRYDTTRSSSRCGR